MAIKRRKFIEGIRLKGSTNATAAEGELRLDPSALKFKAYVDGAERSIVTEDQAQDLTNKTIDADNNTITNIETDNLKAGVLVTDISTATSDTELPSALAVKVALEGQNDAVEINYTSLDGQAISDFTEEVGVDNVKDALDILDEYSFSLRQDLDSIDESFYNHTDQFATGAHKASNISNAPSGNLAATDVQGALDELQSDIDTRALADNGTITNASIETPSKLEVKQDTEANLITYASTADDGQIVFATDTQKMYQIIDNELEPIGGGGSTSFEISQTTHGFAVGDGIYHNGTTWVTAQADDPDTLAYHVVVQVPDANTFIAADFGRIEAPSHGFTVGQYYFLSDSVAGQPTITEPSSFSNPLFYVETADILQIKCLRPEQVGADTNLDDISDVSASTAVEGDIIKYNGSFWESSKVTEQVISLVAAEGLSVRDAVYVNSLGQAAKVDADDDAKIEFIGFAREAKLASESVEIVVSGKLAGFSGLTPGEFVYADPSTPGAVVQPEPTQANVYLIKVGKAISATEILVNPDLASSAEFNREVVADQTILNNQSVAQSITGLSFDGATYRAVVLRYAIYRVTDDNEVAQTGQLRLTYKTNAASWSITDDFGGDDAGVTFSVDSTGQILYTSTDLTGANYSSSLKVNTVELFEI
jgi:hypothetical protein